MAYQRKGDTDASQRCLKLANESAIREPVRGDVRESIDVLVIDLLGKEANHVIKTRDGVLQAK